MHSCLLAKARFRVSIEAQTCLAPRELLRPSKCLTMATLVMQMRASQSISSTRAGAVIISRPKNSHRDKESIHIQRFLECPSRTAVLFLLGKLLVPMLDKLTGCNRLLTASARSYAHRSCNHKDSVCPFSFLSATTVMAEACQLWCSLSFRTLFAGIL